MDGMNMNLLSELNMQVEALERKLLYAAINHYIEDMPDGTLKIKLPKPYVQAKPNAVIAPDQWKTTT